jgi:hypothetical protein
MSEEDPMPVKKKRGRPNGHHKARMLTRSELDGRTTVAKQFDAIALGIAQDLGGEDQLSTIQKHLVEAFAGAAVVLNDINTRAMSGVEAIDLLAYSTAVSTLVRVASKIGLRRVPKDRTPSLSEILREEPVQRE